MPVDHVLFHLGDVVGHIVDDVHVQILGGLVEDLRKGLASQKRHRRSVHPSVISGGSHTLHVVLTLHRVDPRTCQLPVVRLDVIPTHGTLHLDQRICGDLVAQSSAARVDHDAHLALLVDAHLLRHERVVDFIDDLDLCVVIASTQCAKLRQPTLLGAARDTVRVRIQHPTVLLAMLLVLRPSIALPQGPINAQLQRLLQILLLGRDDAHGAHTDGNVVEQGLR
mmetsp:Transcript_95591/g.242972  ORF Transcript_95591/g.242972 Transcript_95591/m.242972 type:complete len:224 (+) Transcript_95591:555-1226(+)